MASGSTKVIHNLKYFSVPISKIKSFVSFNEDCRFKVLVFKCIVIILDYYYYIIIIFYYILIFKYIVIKFCADEPKNSQNILL